VTLTKDMVDKIIELRKEGWSHKKIAEQINVSVSTVKKYCRSAGVAKPEVILPSLTMTDVTFKAINDLFVIAENLAIDIGGLIRDYDYYNEVMRKKYEAYELLFKVNKDYARKCMETYSPLPDFFKEKNLAGEELKLKESWVELLKRYCPEKLAELI